MWPDWVSNPGPLTYKSGALLIALRGPALGSVYCGCKVSLTPVLQVRSGNWDNLGIIFHITA